MSKYSIVMKSPENKYTDKIRKYINKYRKSY